MPSPLGCESTVVIPCGSLELPGTLTRPPEPRGVVVFIHGSGSSQFSRRNRSVAEVLVEAGFAALLFDLLARQEASAQGVKRSADLDIAMLGRRVVAAIDWVGTEAGLSGMPLALFGSSSGAAAALQAAADRPQQVCALVCRGGRPDLASGVLGLIHCPTLMIVGERDPDVLMLNRWAANRLAAPHRLVVVPGASHLFGEPGAIQQVAALTMDWLVEHLNQP